MPDLRESLHVLVERPPSAPVAVEVVAARGARFERRRRVRRGALGLALMAVVSAGGIGIARSGSETDVALATGGRTSAGYLAENPGGYVASGSWRLTITRDGRVIQLTSTSSPDCGPIGLIQPGDEVRGSITGRDSTLRAGERFACPE